MGEVIKNVKWMITEDGWGSKDGEETKEGEWTKDWEVFKGGEGTKDKWVSKANIKF